VSISRLVTEVDQERSYNNLSSALRLFALDFCRQRMARREAAPAAP
jgi:predicted DNA-binding ribbon-helix-helix protein